mmetsp:Transcript_10427/g.18379  ORF Transcript_10427/g.18379 Transcript_10427/m.18379 type:complete len:579 (+) Transcript_10427:61-1797(+)
MGWGKMGEWANQCLGLASASARYREVLEVRAKLEDAEQRANDLMGVSTSDSDFIELSDKCLDALVQPNTDEPELTWNMKAGANSLETIEAQLKYVVDIAAKEGAPLLELHVFWKRRFRERFTVSNLLRAALVSVDMKLCITKVQAELRIVYGMLGKLETLLAELNRVRKTGGEHEQDAFIKEAESFLDYHVLQIGGSPPLTPIERMDKLLASYFTGIVVSPEALSHLQNQVPLVYRLGGLRKIGVTIGLGIGLYVITSGIVSEATSEDGLLDNIVENGPPSAAPESAVKLSLAETAEKGVVEAVSKNVTRANTWIQSGTSWSQEHIVEPTRSMFSQMFWNKGSQQRAAREHVVAVKDAKISLRHMIRDHASRSGASEGQIKQQVQELDMSLVSREYESQIQSPIRNAVSGNLLELALIQSQAVKVQLLEAMLQVDTLMEENRFNSQLVILAPSLLVVGALYSFSKWLYKSLVDDTKNKSKERHLLRTHVVTLSTTLARLHDLTELEEEMDIEPERELLEGEISQLTLGLRNILEGSGPGRTGQPYHQLLDDMLGRNGVSTNARALLCNQLLLIVSTDP